MATSGACKPGIVLAAPSGTVPDLIALTLLMPDGRSRPMAAPAVPGRGDFVSVGGAEYEVQDLAWSEDNQGQLAPQVILIRMN